MFFRGANIGIFVDTPKFIPLFFLKRCKFPLFCLICVTAIHCYTYYYIYGQQ